ncbi:GFA family protein [Methylomonas sp. UP202]|uniref:GFA family protein n=1 Tax=Methylomonas sp. UP202 TaxID=3040943 RepID=UPI002478AE1B|nr:GFA family protein [Methylomonas sp. UP202]WGS83990.1 GFA family protein [Methylomonas sp. UP202]
MSKLTGSSLCGAVQYEIASPLRFARNCHCTMCRKATGAAFATWAYVEYRNFRWIQGNDLLGEYRSSPDVRRTFCKVCGSTLQYIAEQAFPDAFGLALGTVDGDPGCKPMRHVMVGSKAPWFAITDHLPQSAEAAPGK